MNRIRRFAQPRIIQGRATDIDSDATTTLRIAYEVSTDKEIFDEENDRKIENKILILWMMRFQKCLLHSNIRKYADQWNIRCFVNCFVFTFDPLTIIYSARA